jgi:hypothetical protein
MDQNDLFFCKGQYQFMEECSCMTPENTSQQRREIRLGKEDKALPNQTHFGTPIFTS